ncbi:response regulator [Streptomyces sp. NPDC058371]|uniref:response regulator n=1 Tax=Streptomyces sp. NPDC058371 TaxID=3346463 RepID=UPI0036564071
MLVVDDNKVIRQLIRVNLELEGIEVVTAADGAECLDIVHQVRPDVITLDVVMPRLDGLRTAARLRADPRTRSVPLAIVSACTQYEVESGLDVGVDAFLAKPFEPAELVRLVRQLMERGSGEGEVPELDGTWGSGAVGAPAPLGSSHGTSHGSSHGSPHGAPHGTSHGSSHGGPHGSSHAVGGAERAGRAGN